MNRLIARTRPYWKPVAYYVGRFLVSFLPPGHPLLENDDFRSKLQIINGVASILIIVLIGRLPGLFLISPIAGYLTGCLIVVYTTGLCMLVLLRARYFRVITFFMIAVGGLINVTISQISGRFPAITVPYLGVFVIALHFLIGRYVSLIGLVFQVIVFYLLDQSQGESVLSTAEYITYWKGRFYANIFVGGFVLWLFSEAFARTRNHTEKKLREARQELERDMELARNIQISLLPPDRSDGNYAFSGLMIPAVRVGGDYYDHVFHEERDWFALGDVTGHGLQAGMLVMQARSLLHHFVQEHAYPDPAEVFHHLNNSFLGSIVGLKNQSFMTFVILRLCANGEVRYCGRHLSFLIHRKAGNIIEELQTEGSWLGVRRLRENEFPSRSFFLETGDTLLLYTDGCTEAENHLGKRYGLEGLKRDFLKQAEFENLSSVNRSLQSAVLQFTGKNQLDDDLTLLTIRRLR